MRTPAAMTLLLLLLLAIAGRALAAPCAEMDSHDEAVQAPAESMLGMDHKMHCDEATVTSHCSETTTTGENTDCDQTCGCCPGHCAGALPAGDLQAAAPLRNTPATAYAEINSSPEPETAIRPPIHP
ncbi:MULTISPECIES: hypothetical protein [unclassified Microbulbifer]|uniref:hypothetical protein n=1 Tax=unclassified Microbulbifer TaxID=2619833 RepID=UPI0027E5079B|nr:MULTISPECIES: hypothetical protein [unclassified Microbulbifer]